MQEVQHPPFEPNICILAIFGDFSGDSYAIWQKYGYKPATFIRALHNKNIKTMRDALLSNLKGKIINAWP